MAIINKDQNVVATSVNTRKQKPAIKTGNGKRPKPQTFAEAMSQKKPKLRSLAEALSPNKSELPIKKQNVPEISRSNILPKDGTKKIKVIKKSARPAKPNNSNFEKVFDDALDYASEVLSIKNGTDVFLAPIYITKEMDYIEACAAINEIKASTHSMMRVCYELFARKGYEALKYTDFKECVTKELAGFVNYDYALKLKNAGEVHMVVCPELPMGRIPESVLRPMHKLPDEFRKKVWAETYSKGWIPSAKVVSNAVEKVLLLGITDQSNVRRSGLESIFCYVDLSPELEKEAKAYLQKLINEFLRKATPINFDGGPTIKRQDFARSAYYIFKKLNRFILDEFEKSKVSVESGMTKSD